LKSLIVGARDITKAGTHVSLRCFRLQRIVGGMETMSLATFLWASSY